MSPAQTRTSVKRTSWLPTCSISSEAHDVAERQHDEKMPAELMAMAGRTSCSGRSCSRPRTTQPKRKMRSAASMESVPPAASRTMEMPPAKECVLIAKPSGILRVENQRGAKVGPEFEAAQADAFAEIRNSSRAKNCDDGRDAPRATMGGAHQTSTTTIGIRTAAVAMRRSMRRLAPA